MFSGIQTMKYKISAVNRDVKRNTERKKWKGENFPKIISLTVFNKISYLSSDYVS